MPALDVMMNRLKQIESEYNQLTEKLMDQALITDKREYSKVAKHQASLRQIVETYQTLDKTLKQLAEAELMMQEDDAEMREMASLEIDSLSVIRDELAEKLEVLLIPKDPDDEYGALVEIRGAAGGDEGNIFAGDLYRMYVKYCEGMGYKTDIMEASEAEMGGYTLISFYVKGLDAYHHFKFESGAHRVQRVPKTETQGRIHTSTATVLVMPDIPEEDVDINPADLVIETHRSSGAGGQHVNKTDSAVRITHTPTGISVNCQDGRSQHDNKATALRIIRARIFEYIQDKANADKGLARRAKIGSGDRSEKIRTYNYPQNRITDHRIGLTLQQLDRVVEGKLDDVIDALIKEEQRQILMGEQ
ncbi:MAG: peptide chain release factor 1 [Erysipelotrichaceae bacterium]